MSRKIHYIGAGNIKGWAHTACGIQAIANDSGSYDTWSSKTIDAVSRSFAGVTCKSCLRNPHAPGGVCAAELAPAVSSNQHITKENERG